MTALGGIGHTLPFLVHNFNVATIVAILVVLVELATITWVRHRFMDTRPRYRLPCKWRWAVRCLNSACVRGHTSMTSNRQRTATEAA